MKTIITPSGFASKPIISFIVKEGISKEDRIIIIRPKEDEMPRDAKDTLSEIKKFVSLISEDIEIDLKFVDISDFDILLIDLLEIFKNINGEVIVNTYGSVREITIGLTIINLLFKRNISKVYHYSRMDEECFILNLPTIVFPLEGMEKKVLELLESSVINDYNSLARALKVSKSTISRIINILNDKKLVSVKEAGKKKIIELSISGRLLANL
ncbi:MAG: CRISPR locus-related DNA-binding protein [Candidatus Heimdallarchaeum endolithica]|uniref:CRISPR locus-related DNA-binding protein n=1 Tax=Candidatus Heimdallarchaeum endolithica TaxID=2876572 RepID=A0A9Y1FPA6_9ARCH|nr:MAG: CRISPR locus-related DNA-binding protein [Candidatus Heimdallarchaeum endolithica]